MQSDHEQIATQYNVAGNAKLQREFRRQRNGILSFLTVTFHFDI